MVLYHQVIVKIVIQAITVNTLKLINQLDHVKLVIIVRVNQLNLDHVEKTSTVRKHQTIPLIVLVGITVQLQQKNLADLDSTVH